jgi:hypothetical protein
MVTLIITVVLIAATLLLLLGIATGWFSRQRKGALGFLTAYHDFSPRDKQRAVEVVIEKKAGKKLFAQESGEDKKDESKQTDN